MSAWAGWPRRSWRRRWPGCWCWACNPAGCSLSPRPPARAFAPRACYRAVPRPRCRRRTIDARRVPVPPVNLRLPPVIFREYDIRGTVGDQLTPEAAYAVGKAFATLGTERLRREPQIAVGHDNRPSGVDLVSRVVSGIEDAGGLAVYVGQ